MRIFKNIRKTLKRLPKRAVALTAAFLILAAPVAVLADWGPARPTFDYNKFDASKSCTDPVNAGGRCGSLTGPVFNSFINTPSYGDERNFTTVSEADKALWKETVSGVTSGQIVDVRVFFHNNANQTTNDAAHNFLGVAKNSRVRVYIPTGQANGFDVAGYVSADNATPTRVYDTATISNAQTAFSLSYVPGSAKLYNNGPFKAGVALSDDVVGANGTQIGYSAKDGQLPGCFEFEGVVTLKVKVNAPGLQISKTVSTVEKPKLTDTTEVLTVNRGDTITWRIDYKNTGSDVLNDITIKDLIPNGLTLVPGSITWIDAARPNGQTLKDDALNGNGVNVGNYAPNGNGVIRFRTTVNKDVKDCEIVNVAYGNGKNVPQQGDTAKIVINNCKPTTPPEKPKELAKTGPADTLAIFAGVSVLGYVAHRLRTLRKFSR